MTRFTTLPARARPGRGHAARGLGAASALALAASVAACGDSPAPPAFAVTIDCAATTAWAFPDTAIGQAASVILLATRADDGDPGGKPARPVLDGPDAAMFRFVTDASSCGAGALAPADTCVALVEYAPTAGGTHAASLHLGKTVLELGGTATQAPQGLVASIRNATSMHGFYNVASSHTVRLVNQAATDIALGAGTFTGTGAAFGATAGCPATLTPGAACELELAATPQVGGCVAGSYRLPSSPSTIEIPISISSVGGVSLSLAGAGAGRVVSSPPGLDCHRDPASGEQSGRCEQVFAAPVTLTALPDASHHFNGWSAPRCAYDETCTVSPVVIGPAGPRSTEVSAAFASPDARQIAVTFAGSGKGLVRGTVNCAGSCTGWLEPGERGQLEAGTPSRFVGWSGACSGPARACDLGLVINDRATTVTFAADDREQTTLLPTLASAITRGGFTPDGELVVAGGAGETSATISRLTLAGDVRWSTTIAAGSPVSLAVAPSGEIYVYLADFSMGAGSLIKLDAAGGIAWQRAVAVPSSGAGSSSLALVPTGGVALLATTEGKVRSYAADGSLAWAAAVPATAAAVAVEPMGVTAVAVAGDSAGSVRRFSASGAPLTPSWLLPPANLNRRMSLAYDALGSLDAQTLWDPSGGGSGTSTYTLSRLDPTGTAIFTKQIAAPPPQAISASARAGGIAVAPNATVFSWISHVYAGRFGFGYPAGALLETYDPQGARTWAVDKPATPNGAHSQLDEGVTVEDVACGPASCAVFGSYTLGGVAMPWIQVFTVP